MALTHFLPSLPPGEITNDYSGTMRKLISDPGRPARLFQLDALRGVGALVVVLYHLTILWSEEVRPTSPVIRFAMVQIGPFGTEAIMFFFLLSGFVLSLSAIEGRPQPWRGHRRRSSSCP